MLKWMHTFDTHRASVHLIVFLFLPPIIPTIYSTLSADYVWGLFLSLIERGGPCTANQPE